ncbi:GIY-YIG nuclease family protein [Rhodopirellula sp.]|nr:GIY-YIG nuclease family protein [Rhodopirellula sp.]MDB4679256.1 GIY-YIG nuclease family protein [Rhodopirellula sp.]
MNAIIKDSPQLCFGANPFNPHGPRPMELIGAPSKKQLRQRLAQSCPRVPGVYGMLDRHGRLIYVGKSKSLRSRLGSYFANSSVNEKGGRIIENTRAILWETQPSDFAALVREQQLIRRFSPRWNVQGVPKRQRPVYLCLGRNPAMFFLASEPPSECVAVEGPFHGAGRMKRAVESLNKVFQLRDCGQKQVFHFAEQLELFSMEHRPGCLRFEVGTCSGPCAAGCTRADYDTQVSAAESFLDGFNDEPLGIMRDQFSLAMKQHQYELAGRAHETVQSLEYVERKLKLLATARRRFTFIYAVPGYDGCGIWYLIHSGEIADAIAAPKHKQDDSELGNKLRQWSAMTQNQLQRGHGIYPYTLQLVASWFRKHRSELEKAFPILDAAKQFSKRKQPA